MDALLAVLKRMDGIVLLLLLDLHLSVLLSVETIIGSLEKHVMIVTIVITKDVKTTDLV